MAGKEYVYKEIGTAYKCCHGWGISSILLLSDAYYVEYIIKDKKR